MNDDTAKRERFRNVLRGIKVGRERTFFAMQTQILEEVIADVEEEMGAKFVVEHLLNYDIVGRIK